MPDEPRASSTVILARDGADGQGVEVFMLRRHQAARFAPNVYVFPGGTVRADDIPPDTFPEAFASDLAGRYHGAEPPADLAALYLAAIRETFEEAGVLLACPAGSEIPLAVDSLARERQDVLERARYQLQAGERTLADVLADFGLRPAYHALRLFSHWVTPVDRPLRYSTWFFVARMPDHQEALHCDVETTDGQWLTARDALLYAERGTHGMVFPTIRHLRRIADHASVDDLLAFARHKPIHRIQPIMQPGEAEPLLPSDVPSVDW